MSSEQTTQHTTEATTAASQQTGQTLRQLLEHITQLVGEQANHFRKLQSQLKHLSTDVEREQRRNAKQRQASTRAKRVVVQKPVSVNADMTKFLTAQKVEAVEGGYTRQVMMKAISSYIQSQKLQLEENQRQWKPDATLVKLFNLDKTQTYSFMNINGLLSRVINTPKAN
jgi:chromatin remodeling complex protein RSC6